MKRGPLELGLGETMMGSSSDSGDGDRSPLDKGLKMGYGKVIHKEISGITVDLTVDRASEDCIG